jgi:hypothetical protein
MQPAARASTARQESIADIRAWQPATILRLQIGRQQITNVRLAHRWGPHFLLQWFLATASSRTKRIQLRRAEMMSLDFL